MISIVLVNWNSGEDLFNCIQSINNHNSSIVTEIIIVDNGSTDNSIALVKNLESVKLIELNQNHGFAKGCNIGARNSSSDYILFLNPDTIILDNIFEKVLMPFSFHDDIGIIGIRNLNNSREITASCSRFPSLLTMFSEITGLAKVFPRFGSKMNEWDHSESKYVDQVIGAFFLVPRFLFNKLGGFDESYFMYYEEVDFALRARLSGYKSYFFSDVAIFHEGGGSSKKVKAKRLFYTLSSRVKYCRKHFSYVEFSLTCLLLFLIEPITRFVFLLISFRLHEIKELAIAYQMFYKSLKDK